MATVLPSEYLGMNHTQAWRYTLTALLVAIFMEYSVIFIFYQTACTINNYYYLENFIKFTFEKNKVKVKPATIWAHVIIGLVPLLIKFCASSIHSKIFQGCKLRHNKVIPLYQNTTIDSKVFLNVSDYLQKNFNPVKIAVEKDIELENVDNNSLHSECNENMEENNPGISGINTILQRTDNETDNELAEIKTNTILSDKSQVVNINEIQLKNLDFQPETIVRCPSNLEPRREFERSRILELNESDPNKGRTI